MNVQVSYGKYGGCTNCRAGLFPHYNIEMDYDIVDGIEIHTGPGDSFDEQEILQIVSSYAGADPGQGEDI